MARLPRNVYRRGDRYYLRVTIRGREVRRSLGRDLSEARRLATLHVARLKGAHIGSERNPLAAAAAAVEHWLDKVAPLTQKPSTLRSSRNKLRSYFLPVAPPNLVDLRIEHVRAMRAVAESKGMAASSVADTLAGIHNFLGWCEREGLIQRAPWERGLMPRIQERAPDRLSDEQVTAILAAAKEPHRSLIRLSLLTGLRRGELIALQWRHVVARPRPLLIVEHTKSGRVRRVPLVPEAVEIIRQLRASTSSVFVSPIREVPADAAVRRMIRRMQRQTGEHFAWHWHQLRHTFACRYLEAGGRLAALQRILGHATSKMTEHYSRLSDESVLDDAERIGAEFRSDLGTNHGTPEEHGTEMAR